MFSTLGRFLGFAAVLAVVVAFASPAHAGHRPGPGHPPSHAAPEIDAAGLGAIVTLLGGGTMVMRSRRGRRPTA